MSSVPRPAAAARRRWGLAAGYALIAALPQLLLVATEFGLLPQAWTLLFGSDSIFPPLFLGNAEVNPLAWAWTIFFGVMALVAASSPGAAVQARKQSAVDDGDYVVVEPEPDTVPGPGQGGAPGSDSAGEGPENLPAVDEQAAGSWFGEGSRLNSLGRYDEAIRCFDRALELDPQKAMAWHAKGNSLRALGRLEEALACFNEALLRDRENARLWHDKGSVLAKLARYDEARRCFNKAHELDPSLPAAKQPESETKNR